MDWVIILMWFLVFVPFPIAIKLTNNTMKDFNDMGIVFAPYVFIVCWVGAAGIAVGRYFY